MDGPENQRLGREVGGRLRSSCSLQRPWRLQGLQSAQSGFDSATLLSAASGVAWTDRALLQPLVSALVRLSLLTAAALTSALEERPCSAHVGCGSGLPHSSGHSTCAGLQSELVAACVRGDRRPWRGVPLRRATSSWPDFLLVKHVPCTSACCPSGPPYRRGALGKARASGQL